MGNRRRNVVAILAAGAVASVSGQAPVGAPPPPPPPAAIPNVPAAQAVGSTGFCVVDGWEYAPRWSMPNNGFNAPSQESCATQCKADTICTGATWIAYDVPGEKKNCWFKAWGTGPVATPCLPPPETTQGKTFNALIDPRGGDCASIQYNGDKPLDCKVETAQFADGGSAVLTPAGNASAPAPTAPPPPAAAPPAATTPPPAGAPPDPVGHTNPADLEVLGFNAVLNKDYGPTQVPAPKVPIKDLLPGHLVTSASECATICSSNKQCNSASYYGDLPEASWPGKKNCYLKALNGCELPPDAETKTDGTIFMISTSKCDATAPGAAPASAPTATAPAVVATAPAVVATSPVATTPAVAPAASAPAPSRGPTGAFAPVPPLGSEPLAAPAPTPSSSNISTPVSGTRTFGAGAPVPPAGTVTSSTSPASMASPLATLAAGVAALVAMIAV